MAVAELIKQKNALMLSLEDAKRHGKNRDVLELASLAASIEGRIAREFIGAKKPGDAVINLISEASCLNDADRLIEAKRDLQMALTLTNSLNVAQWVHEELQDIPE